MNTGYIFRCAMPDGRTIRERRGGERDRLGKMVLSTPELDEAMNGACYFTLGANELQPYDAHRDPIGAALRDPHRRAPVALPASSAPMVSHDDLVCGCRGWIAFDVVPARNSSETQLRGVWLPALMVASPDEVLLASGEAVAATTPAIHIADPRRVPAGNFVLSKSGQPWTRDADGPRRLGERFGSIVQPIGRIVGEGGAVAVHTGAGWRIETLA